MGEESKEEMCVTKEQAERIKRKSKKTHPGSREKKKTREREEARG